MPIEDSQKFVRCVAILMVCSATFSTSKILGGTAGRDAQAGNNIALKSISPVDSVTEFTITDGDQCSTVKSGAWKLSGTLDIRFAGRILPHENTRVVLYGNGVSAISGKFERITLPKDWLCDISYDYQKPEVILKNFRPDRPLAFPSAEGFGKYAIGGRGGRVIAVTNLNDNGPGSFRAACSAEGPRVIVFRISGTIPLESQIKITNPYITIAGQTAPGDGICVGNHQVKYNTHDVVIRYMRFRPGDTAGIVYDGFNGTGDNAIIDHCSVSWSIDETLSINKGQNFSVQWCMVTESLYHSIHPKGNHGYGGLWGGPGGSWHHNILAHHSSRNPRASANKESGLVDIRNNVIYNWGFNSAYGGELFPANWINNYYKFGPATEPKVRHRIFYQTDAGGRMYVDGNYVWSFPDVSKDNWRGGIDFSSDGNASESTFRAKQPFVVAPVRTQPAEEAFELILKNAGASLARDAVDARIVDEIRSGTAHFGATWGGGRKGIIDSQADVGGWPELKSRPAPADTDNDGMPDDWEKSQGLDPRNAADGALAADGDGYTNVEVYLNSLVPAIYTK
jgi:hypothetical protein